MSALTDSSNSKLAMFVEYIANSMLGEDKPAAKKILLEVTSRLKKLEQELEEAKLRRLRL